MSSVTAACPECQGVDIIDHPKTPGVFWCQGCETVLMRLARAGGSVLGDSHVYVNPSRRTATVHPPPRASDNAGSIDLDD